MKAKSLLIAATLLFTLASCNNTGRKNASNGAGAAQEENAKKSESGTVTSKKTIQLSRADFLKKVSDYEKNPDQWVYLGDKPCIVDFYADWCGPCKTIAPILEELANEYDGEIYIYKVDTDAEQDLSADFDIQGIPALLFVPMEGDPEMLEGAFPKEDFKKAINELLLKKS